MATTTCNASTVIAKNIKVLMQLLTNEPEMKQFNMQMILTKCLNTSVVLVMLLLGSAGLSTASECSVDATQKRNTPIKQNNTIIAKATMDAVLKPLSVQEKGRLHYIMLTDSYLKKTVNNSEQRVYFPGHVFVIEVFPGGSQFGLYQSFINEYDIQQHYEHRGNTMYLNRAQMKLVLQEGVVNFMSFEEWTDECSKCFSLLTHLEPEAEIINRFIGANKSGILICHREAAIGSCAEHLVAYVKGKLDMFLKQDESQIYGDNSTMTVGTIVQCLTVMLQELGGAQS